MQQFASTLTPGEIAQILGVLIALATTLAAYLKLRPEKQKLAAERQLSSSEAAALITDKALALLAETEEQLRLRIAELEAARDAAIVAHENCRKLSVEMETQISDLENSLYLARQQSTRLNGLVQKLTAQLKEEGITPKPLDF